MVSANYIQLGSIEEARSAFQSLSNAWKSPEIPMRQWKLVESELEMAAKGRPPATYKVAIECLKKAGLNDVTGHKKILDIGAGCAHYRDILSLSGIVCDYTACDYSESFRDLAQSRLPGLKYDVSGADKLPYADETFDVVLSSAILMHMMDWQKAAGESVRVSKEWVLFHRTPVMLMGATRYYRKDAYGIPCLEIHFAESELIPYLRSIGLRLAYTQTIFMDGSFGHRSYLLRKG